jgi:hypothetical protein
MKISKAHKEFAYRLQRHFRIPNKSGINYPELYLGPNWESVINFWLYLDILNVDQLMVVGNRYGDLSDEEQDIAYNKAWNAAKATTEYFLSASNSAYYSVSYVNSAAANATSELLGLEKLLKQGNTPKIFPYFLDTYK